MSCSEPTVRIDTAPYPAIVEHLLGCADAFSPPLSHCVDIPEYAQKIRARAVTFEAWYNEVLVGLVAVYFNDNTTRLGFISNVSVLEKYRGFGIASHLLRRAIEFGVRRGFRTLTLEVGTDNIFALQLYKGHGFRVVEQTGARLIMNRLLLAEAPDER